jgi:hypothetical protein
MTAFEVGAQSYRGWASTSARFFDMRPFGLDTIPRDDILTDTRGRLFYEGIEVSCDTPDLCTGYVPLPKTRSVAATQDLSLTYWGFGIQGLSFTTLVRARARMGGESLWPRSDDEFDAILGYAQLTRGGWQLRAGRQDLRTGLGFSGFDGLRGAYEMGSFHFDAYAGRSLARGLREPANEALRALDDFLVDFGAYLIGGGATLRRLGTTVTARYHREILSDRSGLVGERASVDFVSRVNRVRLSGAMDYDFGFGRAGKGHLTLSRPFADGRWITEVVARRYVPYFELSTIWGFFDPVPYSELLTRVGWSPRAGLALRGSGGWRTYGDAQAPEAFGPLEREGWRADAGLSWQPSGVFGVDARYQLEWGPGAFLNSFDLRTDTQVSERLRTSVLLTSFQQFEEYRVGDGRAYGATASGDFRWSEATSINGGISILRYSGEDGALTSPWNQARGWLGARFDVGADPGLGRRR